jgi:hypothetical protein
VAARIGELKKPSVSAWAVNQLARHRELDVQRLIKTGEALEQAQREAIEGGESGGFQAARHDEAAALGRLVDEATKIVPSASSSTLERVAKTLRAAAATPEGRNLIRQGRLTEDLEPPGFEALSGLARKKPRTAPTRGARPITAGLRRRLEALRAKKRTADEETKRTAEEARELEQAAREADQSARTAKRAAEAARKRADAAVAQARRLEAELAKLEKS